VTVIDDGTIPGGFGTSPFDGEGIPTAPGDRERCEVLTEHLHREKKLRQQQCFARAGWDSWHRSGTSAAREKTPKEVIGAVLEFCVTEFLGHGANQ
jgi:PmbA protein